MIMINWDETKERLRRKIAKLTDDNNLLSVKVEQDKLISRLEAKLGQSREAIIKIISKL